jgi:hypothetical protein
LVQDAAFHDTSPAAHVVAPPTGGVKFAAFAWSDMRSCLVAVASTMLDTVTEAALDAVLAVMSFTVKVTPAGTVTRA